MDHLPSPLREMLVSLGLTVLWASLGRLLWHIRKVQHKERRFWSLHLFYELGIAVGIGLAADGLAAWLGLDGAPARAFVIAVAYLGPGGLEHLFWKLADRWAVKP